MSVDPADHRDLVTALAPSDADVREVAALQARSFAAAWREEDIRADLSTSRVARLYVIRADGHVIAYCACMVIVDELHINSLAVDEAWRRRGVARHLVQDVFRDVIAEGVTCATLEVRRSNEAARRLYEGLGFVVEAVRREYYQSPREDALVLWRRNLSRDSLV